MECGRGCGRECGQVCAEGSEDVDRGLGGVVEAVVVGVWEWS